LQNIDKKILVQIDGSECSLNAAKYAIYLAKDKNAQLFCIHVIASILYGYSSSPYVIDKILQRCTRESAILVQGSEDMTRKENIAEQKLRFSLV
jgi:nucleotide-binding universal stress UspA family protein